MTPLGRNFRFLIVVGLGAAALVTASCHDDGPAAPRFEISGTVTTPAGQPASASVAARQAGRFEGSAVTNPTTGAWTIGGLPAGATDVTASASGFASSTTTVTVPTAEPINLQLRPARQDH